MKTRIRKSAKTDSLRQKEEEQFQKSFVRSISSGRLVIFISVIFSVATAIIILSEVLNDWLLPRFALWEVHILTIVGIPISVAILAYFVRKKEAELYRNIVRENMERKQAEEKLEKANYELKELNATKDKFFSIIAHDLKNPFTGLIGSSELLLENIHTMDPENILELTQVLNDSAKSGYAILQNLLDWSRSQTRLMKINIEKINLKDLIEENISNLLLNSINKEIDLRSDVKDDIFITTDRNMINIVIRNLLSNAVKYTPRSGKVNISTILNGNSVSIMVKDTGIGISEDNINKLFRIDTDYKRPGTANEQGTGLGLKLSKEFVEKLGGIIWVESELGKGCDFKFTLPLDKQEKQLNT
ncbi:MAG TPA: HAMP domain-containing sensor histidine kinase [Bacteroidales bacterium]|nr:HAMP domain-containing sensor histidine kinase [Bacteroidales bacterium]